MRQNHPERSRSYRLWLLGVVLLLTIPACGGNRAPDSSKIPPPPAIKTVVVMGFNAPLPPGEKPDLVRNTVTGTTFMSYPVTGEVVEWLTERLFDMLAAQRRWGLIPPGQARGAMENFLASDAGTGSTPLKLIQDVGKTFRADAVLTGQVYRWRERVGSDFGVESPASVAFDLSLIRSSDGAILWRGNYDKTQQSLMENIFDFKTYMKGKGLWLRARGLAQLGLDKMLAEMPGSPPVKEDS
ncbi:MAG: hypothetical protein JRJ09_02080 [Deltaproteobacteria bacterium]|nr:hypothetical protein [Deltaproteobacteria bacterium]MBW2047304.1 hypothetical protein [Deltaproteobacteria bacterium]